MKKGFTLIEVIIALMIITIFLGVIINESSSIFGTNALTKDRDAEYNLARGVCERFKGENGVVQNKTVVIYSDDLSGIPVSIVNTINFGVNTADTSYVAIKAFNLQNKSYVVILNGYVYEYIYSLSVTVKSMLREDTGITLKIAK